MSEQRPAGTARDGILEATAIARRSAMTQPPSAQPAPQRTPLSAEEKARAEVNFSPYVAQALAARGWFRVSADTPEMVELFQQVARRVGDTLRRPVVSYANGREILITFGQEEPPGLTGHRVSNPASYPCHGWHPMWEVS
jgi:hypothetical protein